MYCAVGTVCAVYSTDSDALCTVLKMMYYTVLCNIGKSIAHVHNTVPSVQNRELQINSVAIFTLHYNK